MPLARICLLLVLGSVLHAQSGATGLISVRISDGRRPMPGRITIVDSRGAPAPLRARADDESLASRPGVVYTSSGEATVEIAPGEYTVWASRGVEYSAQRRTVTVSRSGAVQPVSLQLTREVRVPGWASGDVHVHTKDLSGHGDATGRERAITLVGEGLQFVVATEHNVAGSYVALLSRGGIGEQITPLRGVEFTTRQGHFNLFPIHPAAMLPDATLEWDKLWPALEGQLGRMQPHVIVLNHPRDLHAGYRPMDPAHYVESTASG